MTWREHLRNRLRIEDTEGLSRCVPSLEKVGCFTFEGCDNLVSLIIPKGSRKKFEQLLPEYKDKLISSKGIV
jgi:hypothetical protein